MERTALLFDVHVPYQDKAALILALHHLAGLRPKPKRVILAGDFADFKDISYFKDDPNRLSFKEELQEVGNQLDHIRSFFKTAELVYIQGNHEQRLDRYLWSNAPQLAGITAISVPELLGLKKRRISYVDNIKRMCDGQQPYSLGKLFVLHGHEKKVTMGAINLSRLYYTKCGNNVIVGHHHRADKYLARTIEGKYEGGWAVGTLGKLSEGYSAINDWVHGFAYVDVFDNGYFDVHNRIIIEGRIVEF